MLWQKYWVKQYRRRPNPGRRNLRTEYFFLFEIPMFEDTSLFSLLIAVGVGTAVLLTPGRVKKREAQGSLKTMPAWSIRNPPCVIFRRHRPGRTA